MYVRGGALVVSADLDANHEVHFDDASADVAVDVDVRFVE